MSIATLKALREQFTPEQSEALVAAIETENRLDEVWEQIDTRFDAVKERFDAVDKRFDGVVQDLGNLKKDVSALKIESAVLKSMVGLGVALQVGILIKLFVH